MTTALSQAVPALPPIALLRCPQTGQVLRYDDGALVPVTGDGPRYRVTDEGIPLFAEQFCSIDGRIQQQHYDRVAAAYVANMGYPHTLEYMGYMDRVLFDVMDCDSLGDTAEICCGHGEGVHLLGERATTYIGVDISVSMLREARRMNPPGNVHFLQGDATCLPLRDGSVDTVLMLGGIHHVPDRAALFREIHRILKPGGHFFFREPVSDFFLWRAIRAVIYRLSPALDHTTERPLLHGETVPILEAAGLRCTAWDTHGFLGFCLFMNSDVLVFNRLFRFVPGIRTITKWSTVLDAWTTRLPGLRRSGLQVVGRAIKPADSAP